MSAYQVSASMWHGEVDGGPLVRIGDWYLGRWSITLNRQYTGDCWGMVGGDSWHWSLIIAREPKVTVADRA